MDDICISLCYIAMKLNLKKKTALITGGANGIGKKLPSSPRRCKHIVTTEIKNIVKLKKKPQILI